MTPDNNRKAKPMKRAILILAVTLAGCEMPEAPPPPSKRFTMEGFGYSRNVITDNKTGCQFLYIDSYKMSGLAVIPGTCKAVTP